MTPVVNDPSAGVELAADTLRGRALRVLLPTDAHVLQRWALRRRRTQEPNEASVSMLRSFAMRHPRAVWALFYAIQIGREEKAITWCSTYCSVNVVS